MRFWGHALLYCAFIKKFHKIFWSLTVTELFNLDTGEHTFSAIFISFRFSAAARLELILIVYLNL